MRIQGVVILGLVLIISFAVVIFLVLPLAASRVRPA